MLIRNVSASDLAAALAAVNTAYENNITWNNYTQANGRGTAWRVTLRCVSSAKPGHRLGVPWQGKQRRMVAACWHVHGTFFDALPPAAIIRAGELTIRPGDRWQDRNIGSQVNPFYFSEACECA